MTILRYSLYLCDEKLEDGFDGVLYLTSEHPFPSPIGTKLFYEFSHNIPCFTVELVVVGYQDDIDGSYGPKGFNMCLKDIEFEDDENPMFIHDEAKQIAEHLVSMGWEIRK